jgi:predicted RNA binding protein YcfA (HicA-like mRNA interferase family)
VKLKPLPPRKVLKALKRIGFAPVRQRGSHIILKHPDGRITVVPVHRGEEIGRGLLTKIIKDAKITRNKFLELVEES